MKEKWYDKKLPWWVCVILYGIGLLVDIWWVCVILYGIGLLVDIWWVKDVLLK